MRYCQAGQRWDSELPRCVKIESTPPRAISPDTRISPDIICKLPEDPIECGFNITNREECESEGCCFNPGGFCYHADCGDEYNHCLNGGRCIQTKWPRSFDCVCKGNWAGRYCQYQPKWSCGRSSWTPQMITNEQNIFINMWRNRGRRDTPKTLKGISNKHLIQILEAGRLEKEKDLETVKINILPSEPSSEPISKGHTRIVGGDRVQSQQQWPWVVMIKQNWKYICAGVLIAPQWVLTAAHCGFEKNIKNNTAPGPSWKVVAGESSQFSL